VESVQQVGVFPDTRWSLILRLRAPEGAPSAEQALNELCQIYWQPLYAFLRRSGHDPEVSKDLVQGFLTHLLSNRGFARVGPTDCRFRQFLLGALRNFLISEARRQGAAKRGGGVDVVSLDVEQAEQIFQTLADDSLSPAAAFDRQWAQSVWTRALQRLREEQAGRGKMQLFETLKPCLTEAPGQNHAAEAQATGLSPAAVALAVHRLRRRLREMVIDELSQTVGAHADLDAELNYFLSIWSQ
jgi:DNA-directed RNA polymerase specialized sigma24 family protein